jgi:integrase
MRRSKPYLTPGLFDCLIAKIPEPYSSMVFVAICTGLRVSELAGMLWNDVHENGITISAPDDRASGFRFKCRNLLSRKRSGHAATTRAPQISIHLFSQLPTLLAVSNSAWACFHFR